MKQIIIIIISGLAVFTLGFSACKKWEDPAAVSDPRLTNPYCNDPDAVNYNWGFPGKPDNTLCYFPTDLFKGTWLLVDSVYITSTGLFIHADSIYLNIYPIAQSHTKLAVLGFCGGGDTLKMTAAAASYNAAVDTTLGDSLTNRGQKWCRIQDTVNGSIFNSRIDSMLHITLQVISDTGVTTHLGKARRL
ncbi:MAG: hypothetical protein H7257_05840 [Taibaiella sp.]|nr:hypothetical protein [Taibaiella sp.]